MINPDTPSSAGGSTTFHWMESGEQAMESMLGAIRGAEECILLETYIFQEDTTGHDFLSALVAARRRGVRVRVLIDALGSIALPSSFWTPLMALGGEFLWFNRFNAEQRYGCRDHRKILVIDRRIGFIGGFNIANVYRGDGITSGWRDLGMIVTGGPVDALADTFAELFDKAGSRPPSFAPLRRTGETEILGANWSLLLCGPGRGHHALKRSLVRDLSRAQEVRIECAYFLPTHRLQRALMRVARRGGKVQLILAGKSDVFTSRLASRSLYTRLMRAGIEIYEYEPQILHSKLFLIDHVAYVGSANLDARSLKLNYELSLRIDDPEVAAGGRAIFETGLSHSSRINPAGWKASRNGWHRLLERLSHLLHARIDPYLTSLRWHTRATDAIEKLDRVRVPDKKGPQSHR